MFLSESEALNCSVPGKYSILSQLSDIFKINQKFEFIIEYPSLSYYFRWRQSNNPISELEVPGKPSADGFESIHNGTNNPSWGGLVKTTMLNPDRINSLLDGHPGVSTWHFAVGMYNNTIDYYHNNGIPSDYPSTDIVRLWIRLPGIFQHCSPNLNWFEISKLSLLIFPLFTFTSVHK